MRIEKIKEITHTKIKMFPKFQFLTLQCSSQHDSLIHSVLGGGLADWLAGRLAGWLVSAQTLVCPRLNQLSGLNVPMLPTDHYKSRAPNETPATLVSTVDERGNGRVGTMTDFKF